MREIVWLGSSHLPRIQTGLHTYFCGSAILGWGGVAERARTGIGKADTVRTRRFKRHVELL